MDIMTQSHLIQTDGFNQLAATEHGYLLYNRNDIYIGRAIEKYGEYSALEMVLFEDLCSAGNAVVEVGANIGAHTVGFSRLVGPQGRVLAFEPQRLVFQTLCANVALNSLTNVDCYFAAVGAQEGAITVPSVSPWDERNFGGLSLLGAGVGAPVPCFMLDRFIDLPRVNLLKVDVEGMEAEVLRGGAKLITKFKPILYVENDRVDQSEVLIRLIASFGYRLFWHLPPLFNPKNFYGEDENLYEDIVSCNMLCLHRDADTSPGFLEEIVDFSFHPIRPEPVK
jgi:FkbM family methyltransferase